MDRLFTPLLRRKALRRAAAAGLVVLFAAFTWLAAVEPAPASFAIASSAAVAWCIWLERRARRL